VGRAAAVDALFGGVWCGNVAGSCHAWHVAHCLDAQTLPTRAPLPPTIPGHLSGARPSVLVVLSSLRDPPQGPSSPLPSLGAPGHDALFHGDDLLDPGLWGRLVDCHGAAALVALDRGRARLGPGSRILRTVYRAPGVLPARSGGLATILRVIQTIGDDGPHHGAPQAGPGPRRSGVLSG